MTTGSGAKAPAATNSGSGDARLGDWEDLRADPDTQFAPVEIPETRAETPDWLSRILDSIGEFFASIFEPVGRWLGMSWPVTKWILLGLAALLVLYVLYQILSPYFIRAPRPDNDADEGWTPQRQDALALLEDADRLAAGGDYDAATHLLLKRSVGQIRAVRPDWIDPSSTAREIASIPALPAAARSAFGTIAQRVERSLFALKSLGPEDWQAARAAYAEFALQRLNSGPS